MDLKVLRAALNKANPALLTSNTGLSLYYLGMDLLVLGTLCRYKELFFVVPVLGYLLWINLMGLMMWALFVVGHDCGHGTFSSFPVINTICGHLAHSPLLVPYHAWQKSHYLHHLHHNHIDKDHSWKPYRKQIYDTYTGIWKYLRFSKLLLGLFPIYLLSDSPQASGNHFNPHSRLFETEKEKRQAWLSIGCVSLFLLTYLASYGFASFVVYYLPCYLVFVCWLDLVTFLHHTDSTGIYYAQESWTFLRGALTTYDRSYSQLIDHIQHNIGHHTIHHLFFTSIPHYHLREATTILKPLLPGYKEDSTPIWKAFVRNQKACQYVPNQGSQVRYVQ
jgi:omega-3 fatty acid desaturase (delta-15 desaturase)